MIYRTAHRVKVAFLQVMALLRHIQLYQFKNYSEAAFDFGTPITGIYGPNGSGKTNLLDAIYYLCFTKSYFTATDAGVVANGAKGMRLQGQFEAAGGAFLQVTAIIRETGKKEFWKDGEAYTKMSAHIGKLPAVMIAPDDVEIITGGSEARRKLADALLCQIDANYLQQLMQYNKILQQRNALLRQMAEKQAYTAMDTLLEVLDGQLAAAALPVALARQAQLPLFLTHAGQHYSRIAGQSELVTLHYQGLPAEAIASEAAYIHMLQRQRQRDYALQRTTQGIHRDDLVFYMNRQPFKQIASQGQRKSLLFAIKLTEYEWLENAKGFAPMLLLDDVFEKLDARRMHNLLTEVCCQKQGQVLITDTHEDRLRQSLEKLDMPFELIGLPKNEVLHTA
jgi:DNA replication and repair protein RecF